MAKTPKKKPAAEDVEPTVLEEPEAETASPEIDWDDEDNNVWLRGLWMLLFAALFELGKVILVVAAVLQFLWLLFGKEKNQQIADFGKDMSDWFARVARFQAGTTEEKPFPFARWGRD